MGATWVPKEQRTPAWELFNTRFLCRVPYMATRSIEHVREFGMPASGDRRMDREHNTSLLERYMTVVQMVVMYKDGVTIRVVNQKDTTRIYELITAHLEDWRRNLTYSLNNKNAPTEDLVDLDNFANAVYPYAQRFFPKDTPDSVMVRGISTLLSVNKTNVFKSEVKNVDEDGNYQPPPRKSMADIFSKKPLLQPRFNKDSKKE